MTQHTHIRIEALKVLQNSNAKQQHIKLKKKKKKIDFV